MKTFKYNSEGELFTGKGQRSRPRHPKYLRFSSAAEAVRYAIEELRPDLLLGTQLEVEEERFGREDIRRLYDCPDYPLTRRALEDL